MVHLAVLHESEKRNESHAMARRQHLSLIVVLGFFACFTLFYLFSGPSDSTLSVPRVSGDVSPVTQHNAHAGPGNQKTTAEDASRIDVGSIPDSILSGGSIAPKLENATIKYGFPLFENCPSPLFYYFSEFCVAKMILTQTRVQSRTRPRLLETIPHDDGPLPREAYRGR